MVVLQLGKKPFLDREAMKGAEESAIWDWLTAFVVMLDKTLMATSFLSVSLFQWPLFPDSNCDRLLRLCVGPVRRYTTTYYIAKARIGEAGSSTTAYTAVENGRTFGDGKHFMDSI